MVAGTRTFSLEETFLGPQVIDPPPTRHALFILLLALAAVLRLGTAGWGDLFDGMEGQFAGGAREMLANQQWLVPTNNAIPQLDTPPLVYWLVALSYKAFGVSPMVARLPGAIAMIACVALTFLIGERFGDYWRGFLAGLIHLCFVGTFLVGRSVTAEPIFSAFIAGAIYCAVCGYQRRKFRQAWFAGFWLCGSLACLTKGLVAIFYLVSVVFLLALFFREARIRFRTLFHWGYLLGFLVLVAPWYIWVHQNFPGLLSRLFFSTNDPGLTRLEFLFLHFVWWSPASFLVLPGLFLATRKIIRPPEFSFTDALPLCWMAVGFLPLFLSGYQSTHSSLSMWSAFALWAALVWERTPGILRIVGIGAVIIAGIAVAMTGFFAYQIHGSILPLDLPTLTWLKLHRLLEIAGLAFAVIAMSGLYFAIRKRWEIALLLVLVAMVPVGLCLTEGTSRVASSFSLASAARFLNVRLEGHGQVLFEGPLRNASSLVFYLNQKFYLVNQVPDTMATSNVSREKYLDSNAVLEAWNRAEPIYLIIEEGRVPEWQELIVTRAHIFHQVASCGRYAILSNQL